MNHLEFSLILPEVKKYETFLSDKNSKKRALENVKKMRFWMFFSKTLIIGTPCIHELAFRLAETFKFFELSRPFFFKKFLISPRNIPKHALLNCSQGRSGLNVSEPAHVMSATTTQNLFNRSKRKC